MEDSEKIRIVSEFANVDLRRAEIFLRRCNGSVDEAVHAALSAPGEDAAAAQREPLLPGRGVPSSNRMSFVARLFMWLRSCFGWIGNFLFPRRLGLKERARQLHPEISDLSEIFIDGPLRATLTQTPPAPVVLALYSEISRDAVIEAAIGNFRRTNFRVHAVAVETAEGFDLARSLRVRSVPVFLGVVTGNFSEICRSEISGLSELLVQLTRRARDLEMGREKISRDREIREEQDREFAAALAQEETRKNLQKKISDSRQAALTRVKQISDQISDPARISVKLQDGTRVEKKFPGVAPASLVYDWILVLAQLDEHKAAAVSAEKLKPGNFYLSTTFPSRRLAQDSSESLAALGLVPNALLVLTMDESDHEDHEHQDSQL